MKKSLIALFLTFVGLSAMAQSKFNVSGTILEDGTNEVVISATVRILNLPDSSMVTGAATGLDGSFNIKNVKAGKYALKITYIGFQTKVLPLDLTNKKDKNVSLGYLHITPDSKMIKDVTVTANVAKVQVSGDSIVYNADAYRVPEGSVLEDLVKKLPGAQVDENGGVTINGKKVNKILVDGKEFFFDDASAAMKNIPTNMIDKLKTYDRKSDFARVTGIDDGEDETVLDLTVKKGMNNGWFGNIDLGYGTKDRWSERFTINRFNNSNQYTLMGGANNTGDMGFGGGGGRFAGGGGMGGGLRNSKNIGFNFATEVKNLEMGGSARYQYNGNDSRSWSSTKSFDTSQGAFSNSESLSRSSAHNWNAQFRFEWTPDSLTNIIFRPSGNLTKNKGYSDSESANFSDDPNKISDDPLDDAVNGVNIDGLMDIIVNTNVNRQQTYSENKRLAGELQANRRLNDYGRNITLRATGNFGSSESKQLSGADIQYAAGGENINNRYYTTPGRNRSFGAQLTYSEPIANRTYLQLSYRFDYSYNKSDRKAFAMDPTAYTELANALVNYRYNIDGAIDYLLNNGYKLYGEDENEDAKKNTQFSEYKNYNQTISLSFRKISDYFNFSAGIDLLPQRSTLDYKYMGKKYDTITRNVFNIAPSLDFRYNFTQQTNLRINYRARTQQPSMTNLLAIEDDSNPLNKTTGNPDLKPSITHNINLNFNTFRMEHQQSIFGWGGVNFTRNSVSNRTFYDQTTGRRETKPFNINGNWSGNLGGGFNTSLDRNGYFTMNTFTSFNYNHQVSYVTQQQLNLNSEDTGAKANTNTIGVNENLGFDFRKDWFEMGINGSLNYNSSKNSVLTTGNMETWTFSYGADMNLIFNNGLTFSTDISQSSRRGFSSANMNTNELLWNAQVGMSFLKGNALSVTLQWNDILKKRSNISRQIDAYQQRDSRYNAIYSYGMLHVIYKLNIFGGGGGRGGFGGMGGFGGGMGGFGGGMGGFGGGFGGGGRR